MISIVLYGRNDSYGYNLHKRAALGLNTMAELLSDPEDEILFVDYNTLDDFPTFPEAIADTLTPAAATRLRILRVRPAVHHALRGRSQLAALEPIARNIAIRRSRPGNRWILSTNPDMIFVPRRGDSLTAIAAGLPAGFYHLPRFEAPESLWEGFDRLDPRGTIEALRTFGEALCLNETVRGPEFVKYDAPGDFQLIARDDLFRIHGFDERMVLGWHVDSNIARRLYLLHGQVGDVADRLFGYHCNHTRQVTPAHQHRAEANDFRQFVEEVRRPELANQSQSWGCPSAAIEEVTLTASTHRVYLQGVREVLDGHALPAGEAWFIEETYGNERYDAAHVLPFIADLIAFAPRAWTAGWVGGRSDTFELFKQTWHRFGFTGRILVPEWSPAFLPVEGPDIAPVPLAELGTAPDILLIDFGAPSHAAGSPRQGALDDDADRKADAQVRHDFAALVAAERTRLARDDVPRRFVCVGAVHNLHERAVLDDIAAASTPFGSRLRHGFVKRNPERYADETVTLPGDRSRAPNIVATMQVGESGERIAAGVRAPFGRRGVVLHGPHAPLPAGLYRAEIVVAPLSLWTLAALVRPVIVQVAAGPELLAQRRVRFFLHGRVEVAFAVSAELAGRVPIHVSLFRGRFVDFTVTSVAIRKVASEAGGVSNGSAALVGARKDGVVSI